MACISIRDRKAWSRSINDLITSEENIAVNGKLIAAVLAIAGLLDFSVMLAPSRAKDTTSEFQNGFESIVDDKGNIALPADDFRRDWTALGSWVVNGDKGAKGLHNVYAEAGVVEHYRKTGEFPDGAILVKELLGGVTGEFTTGTISYANELQGWFVMVKDRQGRFAGNPLWGKGWGWAYFDAKDRKVLVTKNYESECLSCHVPAESTDWIYTEAYPVLGEKALDNDRHKALVAQASGTQAAATQYSAASAGAASSDDALVQAGQKVFARCKSCHSDKAGQNRTGPTIAGIIGRKAGSVEGYKYSDAMKSADVVWSAETLDKFLGDVAGFIPDNRMAKVFRNGVANADDRKAVIAYLMTLKN